MDGGQRINLARLDAIIRRVLNLESRPRICGAFLVLIGDYLLVKTLLNQVITIVRNSADFLAARWIAKFTFLLVILLALETSAAEDQAKLLFERMKSSVVQVKVIDLGSGSKSSIGSAFYVGTEGTLATNYHVISDYINDPEKYRIEVLGDAGNVDQAEVINFNIVHDLALIRIAGSAHNAPLNISIQAPYKGTRIFSLGNPQDLGMTIIEGIYNGLVEGSRFEKFLFSGSLNGGMSGGPAINSDGAVIGVNVSKGGEQISFLVPARLLNDLIEESNDPIPQDQYKARAYDELNRDQDQYFSRLISAEWPISRFMNYQLPDKIDKSLKCWGHTLEKRKNKFDESHRHCRTDDRIYVSNDVYTGSFSYSYIHIASNDLSVFQFYNYLEKSYAVARFSNGGRDDTTNFYCDSSFVEFDETKWKVSTCVREYYDYRGLYDAVLQAMRVDQPDAALAINVSVMGIGANHLKSLHQKVLEAITWKP